MDIQITDEGNHILILRDSDDVAIPKNGLKVEVHGDEVQIQNNIFNVLFVFDWQEVSVPVATSAIDLRDKILALGSLDLIREVKVSGQDIGAVGAYSVGDIVGGLVEIANFFADVNTGAILQRLGVFDIDEQEVELRFWLFNEEPADSTLNDNVAIDIVDGDLDKVIASILIESGDYVGLADNSIGEVVKLACPLTPSGDRSVWLAIEFVANPAPTYTADGLSAKFGLV